MATAAEQVKRNKAIIQWYKRHPGWSLSQMADKFGLTPERIGQIIRSGR